MRRHGSRPVAASVSLSAVHMFSIFAGEIAEEALPSGLSYLETHFQGADPVSALSTESD